MLVNTEHLCLKTPEHVEATAVLAYMKRNKAFFEPWMPTWHPHCLTETYWDFQLKKDTELLENKQQLKFWVYERVTDTVVGDVNFSNIVWGAFQSCYVGYKMDAQHNGKGWMTEALQAGIQQIFGNEWQLHRVEANIIPHNKGSIRVAEKVGFELEGRSKDYLKINGQWEDHMRYVMFNKNPRMPR